MSQITTDHQYDEVIRQCREIFLKKTMDYGTAWRVYRPVSVADQLYIKAKRIRNIQEGVLQKIEDSVHDEFAAILNYAIIGLMQLEIEHDEWDIDVQEVSRHFDAVSQAAKQLMHKKNNDYGEAWRDMSVHSLTDLIMSKVLRIKQIVQNDGKTMVSEGIDANYFDILNYAAFALILLSEEASKFKSA